MGKLVRHSFTAEFLHISLGNSSKSILCLQPVINFADTSCEELSFRGFPPKNFKVCEVYYITYKNNCSQKKRTKQNKTKKRWKEHKLGILTGSKSEKLKNQKNLTESEMYFMLYFMEKWRSCFCLFCQISLSCLKISVICKSTVKDSNICWKRAENVSKNSSNTETTLLAPQVVRVRQGSLDALVYCR